MKTDLEHQLIIYGEYLDELATRPAVSVEAVRRPRAGWIVALAAACLVLIVGIVPVLLMPRDESSPAETSTDSVVGTTTTAFTPATPSTIPGSWTFYSAESGLAFGPAGPIAIDPNGTVWTVGWDHGIYRLDGERWQFTTMTPTSEVPTWLEVTGDGQIVVFETTSLYLFDGTEWTDLGVGGPIGEMVSTSARRLMPSGDLVVGFWSESVHLATIGKNGVEVRTGDKPPLGGPLGWNAHWSQTITSDGALWLGGADGITVFDGDTFTFLRPESAEDALAAGCCVSPLAEDSVGGMWAQIGRDLYRYDELGWRLHTSRPDLPDVLFTQPLEWAIVAPTDTSVWLYQRRGMAHFNGEEWTSYTSEEAEALGLPTIAWGRTATSRRDSAGATWVLDRSPTTSVHRFDDGSWAAVALPSQSLKSSISTYADASIAISPDGELWLATENGVARFTPDE